MISHEVISPEVVQIALTVGEGLLVLGLNFRQRKTIRERDQYKCQFPVPNHKCNGKEELHVNHILPQKYARHLGVNPDYPENLITLCENSHVGDPSNGNHIEPIHPDIRDAKKRYGKNKRAIEEAIRDQQEKLAERQVYWNTEYDRGMSVIAVRNTQRKDKKEGGRSRWWPW